MTKMMLAMFTVSEDSPTPALQPITYGMVQMVTVILKSSRCPRVRSRPSLTE